MKRAALLIALVLVVLCAPRTASRTPFAWSPAPWPAAVIPSVFLGVDESDQRPTGAPSTLRRELVPVTPDQSTGRLPVPVGAPLLPAGRTSTGERSTPMPAPLVGWASFYDAGPGEYAALPGFRTSQLGMHVIVTGFVDGRSISITVAVVTSCQCYVGTVHARIVDLSPSVFLQVCGPLSKGLCRVTVRRLQ